ncbi:hypothetical protein CORC01_10406 [Colletotrichum orchidophilum]|uniref:Uncharacterized protein n=1 Tax=Colletotrichum orchidophilum TaxID=1209926 RepID=A0A1G4AYQ2_9PEZI|nr:uncharacterized protein CORC01_10406 [Colletotrichum orchidophilum]OHE94246.1 hypothetical protein CORC01_10406 [Colletotrichum orchidophilum]
MGSRQEEEEEEEEKAEEVGGVQLAARGRVNQRITSGFLPESIWKHGGRRQQYHKLSPLTNDRTTYSLTHLITLTHSFAHRVTHLIYPSYKATNYRLSKAGIISPSWPPTSICRKAGLVAGGLITFMVFP